MSIVIIIKNDEGEKFFFYEAKKKKHINSLFEKFVENTHVLIILVVQCLFLDTCLKVNYIYTVVLVITCSCGVYDLTRIRIAVRSKISHINFQTPSIT